MSTASVAMKPPQIVKRQKMQIVCSLQYVAFLYIFPPYLAIPPQDAESRLTVLRTRAGITPPHSPPPDNHASRISQNASGSTMTLSSGHINLFADLEEHTTALAAHASKSKPAMTDLDHGVPLAPSKQDLHPWYSVPHCGGNDDKTAEARR
jgi:hypothetical protein